MAATLRTHSSGEIARRRRRHRERHGAARRQGERLAGTTAHRVGPELDDVHRREVPEGAGVPGGVQWAEVIGAIESEDSLYFMCAGVLAGGEVVVPPRRRPLEAAAAAAGPPRRPAEQGAGGALQAQQPVRPGHHGWRWAGEQGMVRCSWRAAAGGRQSCCKFKLVVG